MKRCVLFFSLFLSVFLIGAQDGSTLKIGIVDPDPAGALAKLKPFTDFASKKLSAAGVTSVTGIIAKDTNEMISLLRGGKVDLYIDSLYPILEVSKSTPLDLSLRRWKKGVGEYKTLFIVKKGSVIKDLTVLSGTKIGFEDSTSTSGRWLPTAVLSEKGYKLQDGSKGQVTGKNVIGFQYTGSAENTPVWLMQNKIDVGVISNNDFDEMPAGLKGNMLVIGESGMVPRQVISFRANLSAPIKAAVKELLVTMDKTPESQGVLKAWEKTAKIDAISPAVLQAIKAFEARLRTAGY